jgi:D-inositol-3-phosphate glycosyltransferase
MGRTVRIALVSEHSSPLAAIGGLDAGGQNVHVAELAARLVRHGHSVAVYTRRDDADLAERVTTSADYEVVHVPAGPAAPVPKDDLWPHMAAFADHLTEMLKFQQPNVVHAHFWMSAWASARAARRLHLPLLVTFHALGSVKRRYHGPADTSPLNRIRVEVAVAGAADRIVATATDEVRELALLGIPSAKVSVVPCGVDLDHFTPEPPTNAPHSAPERRNRYRLLSVGRLVPRMGYDIIIEALTRLPETELLIAGGAGSGDGTPEPEHDRLVAVARRLEVADRAGPAYGYARPAALCGSGGLLAVVRAVRHRSGGGHGLRCTGRSQCRRRHVGHGGRLRHWRAGTTTRSSCPFAGDRTTARVTKPPR